MRSSVMVGGWGLVFMVAVSITSVLAQPANRGQQQAPRRNQQNQAAANANANAVPAAVQLLLQQFDRNGNRVLDGEELVQVAAAFQQLIAAGAIEGGAGQGFGAAGQGFGNANGGNQHAVQQRSQRGFQHGQGGAGGGGNGGRGAGGR